MTIKKNVEFLKLLYDRLEIGEECVDVSDISVQGMIEAVDTAIEALEAIGEFEKWRMEVYGNDD